MDQMTRWNGVAGQAWIETQEVLDRMFKPFEHVLVEAVLQAGGREVLDIGCGTGATTLAIARAIEGDGRCTGVDISSPMIDAARARAQEESLAARLICADAQTHDFEPGSADMIVSRFGVMFFGNPVAAFTNLHRAAKPKGLLKFIAWRSAAENPFMTAAERAAAPLLPGLAAREPNGPGQFAFADATRVEGILRESGWAHVDIERLDVTCVLPETKLERYFTRLGPVGLILSDLDDTTRQRVIETVRRAFAPYVQGSDVRFTSACWLVSAQADD